MAPRLPVSLAGMQASTEDSMRLSPRLSLALYLSPPLLSKMYPVKSAPDG